MEVRFNKRNYLDPEFLKMVVDDINIYSECNISTPILYLIKEQLERGNNIIDIEDSALGFNLIYGSTISPTVFEIEPLYKKYYLLRYMNVFTAIPEIVYTVCHEIGDGMYGRHGVMKCFSKYRHNIDIEFFEQNITKIINRYSLEELQKMVFKCRVLPLRQLLDHYLAHYILENHIARFP